jgi:pimeloyl-ACP methyl ester carboxylesterase
MKPTIVLVHGAFADASSWNGVIERLQQEGYTVIAPPNPLRGVAADSAYLASFLNQIDGPVQLTGHSYGGAVITNAATSASNVVGLVYVAAFAPDGGENLGDVENGSTDSVLNAALVQYTYPTGRDGETSVEFAINPARIREAFAADLPAETTALMAATQPPSPPRRSATRPDHPPGGSCRPGQWSPPATRPQAPMSSARTPGVRAQISSRSRAPT